MQYAIVQLPNNLRPRALCYVRQISCSVQYVCSKKVYYTNMQYAIVQLPNNLRPCALCYVRQISCSVCVCVTHWLICMCDLKICAGCNVHIYHKCPRSCCVMTLGKLVVVCVQYEMCNTRACACACVSWMYKACACAVYLCKLKCAMLIVLCACPVCKLKAHALVPHLFLYILAGYTQQWHFAINVHLFWGEGGSRLVGYELWARMLCAS